MELCLGTVQLGTQYGIQNNTRPSAEESMKILSDALSYGIHWFDTARAYGESEAILGQFASASPLQAQSMRIVSKLDPGAFRDAPRREWKSVALKKAAESLQTLKRDRLDAFLFHNAVHIFDEYAVEALDYVREKRLAQSIGVSIYTPKEAMQALEYPQIDLIQIPYNIFDQRLNQCGFFRDAKRKNVRIYARSSLLQGLAVMEPDKLPCGMEFAIPYVKKFRQICLDYGISPLQAAIGYVVGSPDIDQIVFGVDSRVQLAEYVKMQGNLLPTELRCALASAFANAEEKLVNPSLWKS